MSLNIKIQDGGGNDLFADVVEGIHGERAIAVSSCDHHVKNYLRKEFSSSEYGVNLNAPITYGATPINVYNGGDNTYWTLNNISGTTASIATERYYDGSASLKWDGPILTSTIELSKGSTQNLSGYVALTFKINIDKNYSPGDSIQIYGYNSGTVGTPVLLENYCIRNDYDSWQSVTIPLSDMGLSNQTITSIRFRVVGSETSPKIYMDTFRIEQLGSNLGSFIVRPNKQTHAYIDLIRFYFVDSTTTTITNGTMPYLSYNKILGQTSLGAGIQFSVNRSDTIVNTIVYRNLGDIISLSNAVISNCGSDGTNTFLTLDIHYPDPIILKSVYDDYLEISISEDLSGLVSFRATAYGHYIDIKGLL